MQNTKKKRGLQSSLFSCPKTHLKYFHYIMNFSKVNVRDLVEAKYEDTYLLITTRFPCFTLALYRGTEEHLRHFARVKISLNTELNSCYIFGIKMCNNYIDNITSIWVGFEVFYESIN